jgi:hypothetical protein
MTTDLRIPVRLAISAKSVCALCKHIINANFLRTFFVIPGLALALVLTFGCSIVSAR